MAVSVLDLTGGDILPAYRGPNVKVIWLVIVIGEAYQYCNSRVEAWALAESLEPELESEPLPPSPSFPGMR